jgi:hypothetical protein
VPGGDVEELLSGLWLLASEVMHQGSASRARPEHQYNVDVTYLWEFVAFLGETSNVIPQGLSLFLPTTLLILGAAGPHIRWDILPLRKDGQS